MNQEKSLMLAIATNLKFSHKFFLEENFETLSDIQFDHFEESLEKTAELIEEMKRVAGEAGVHPEDASWEALSVCSELLEQFWTQQVDPEFTTKLQAAVSYLSPD